MRSARVLSAYKKPPPEWACYKCFIPLLGGCFGNYHTAVAVARLRFASLDRRKASVWIWIGLATVWRVCVRPLMADPT